MAAVWQYHQVMSTARKQVEADEEEIELSGEELAELDAAIEEADRGEVIPAEEVLRELRARRDEEIRRRRA